MYGFPKRHTRYCFIFYILNIESIFEWPFYTGFTVLWSMGNKLVPSPHFKSLFYYQQGLKFRYIRHGRAYTYLNLDNRQNGDFTSGCRCGLFVSWIKRRKRFIVCKILLAKQFE